MLQIPLNSFFNTLLKLEAGLPTQLALQLGAVYGVTQVMAGTVCHVCNQIHIGTLGSAKQTVNGIYLNLYDVNVFPLIESAYIVGLGHLALMEDQVYGTRMVHHIQPVTHVLTLAVYGQRFAVTYIINKQRNELLRELIWSVVV